MKKGVKKGLDITAIVLACLLFAVGVMLLSMSITKNKDGVPRVFGVTLLDIRTDSMAAGDHPINPGDMAVITKVDSISDLKEGDVITFWDIIDGKRELNTHRIVKIVYNEAHPEDSTIVTKGDNVAENDQLNKTMAMVVGKYQFRLLGLGYVVRFLQSGLGFFFIIILPLIAFLVYRVVILIKVILDIRKEKAAALAGGAADAEQLRAELEMLRAKVAGLEDETNSYAARPSPPAAEIFGGVNRAETSALMGSDEKDGAGFNATESGAETAADKESAQGAEGAADAAVSPAAEAGQGQAKRADDEDLGSDNAAGAADAGKSAATAAEVPGGVEPAEAQAAGQPAASAAAVQTPDGQESAETEPAAKAAVVKTTAKKSPTAKSTGAKTTAAKSTTAKSTAAKTTTAKSTAAKTTAAKTETAKSAGAKTTAAKTTTAKSTAAKTTTAKSTAAKSTAAKTTTAKSTAAKTTSAKSTAKSTTAKAAVSKPKQENAAEKPDGKDGQS